MSAPTDVARTPGVKVINWHQRHHRCAPPPPTPTHPTPWQMELRYNEADRARQIFERYVKCIPSVKAWVREGGQAGLGA